MNNASPRQNQLLRRSLALLAAAASLTSASAFAEKEDSEDSKKSSTQAQEASIQASTRKIGLDIVAPVMVGGTDEASKTFQTEVLPSVTKLLSAKLGEYQKVDDSAYALDPAKLQLQTDSNVRVYFVGEGASYANSLGFNTTGSGVDSGNPLLVFPNASSALSSYDPAKNTEKDDDSKDKYRTKSTPLLPGDFVDLGTFKSGSALDFFLIADGYNGGGNTYSTDESANPDKINHVVAFAYAMPDSPYLIIGFEDLYGGGDRDFNDLLFAVDIGAANVAALTATPEPATYLSLGAFLGLGLLWKRRQDRSAVTTTNFAVA